MSVSRTRHPNVLAAQWSANGGAMGVSDLTLPGSAEFGESVFGLAEQRKRLPKDVFKACSRRRPRARRWTSRWPTRSPRR